MDSQEMRQVLDRLNQIEAGFETRFKLTKYYVPLASALWTLDKIAKAAPW